MEVDKVRRARGAFYSGVSTMRGGDRIMRALATELMDLQTVSDLPDHVLLRLPGFGIKNLQHFRTMLKMALEEQNQ